MYTSCQKLPLLNTPEIDDQLIDLSIEKSPQILISEKEYFELKCEVAYWQAMHKKAVLREAKLKQAIEEQKGQIRDLRNRLFGKKSEKKNSGKHEDKFSNLTRPRGQQPGSEGHGRTERPYLPEIEEKVNFPGDPICPNCGKPYIVDESTETKYYCYL